MIFVSLDHFTAKLSVRTQNGPDLVSTSFTFFDCSTHLSCTQCVSSQFPCDWCVEAHRCTHDTAENCRNDILVTGVSVSINFILVYNLSKQVDLNETINFNRESVQAIVQDQVFVPQSMQLVTEVRF